jgi:cytochrome oxidase assembly protein ShyY1
MRLDDAAASQGGTWPRVMNYPRREDVEQALQHAVQQRIVLLDPSEPDGYGRNRELASRFGTGRHIGYAAQWFGLALAALGIYLLLSFKKEQGST